MNFRISIQQKQIQLNKYEQIDPSKNQVGNAILKLLWAIRTSEETYIRAKVARWSID